MEATCSTETSVDFQRTTRRYIQEDNDRCENVSYVDLTYIRLSPVPSIGDRKTLCGEPPLGTYAARVHRKKVSCVTSVWEAVRTL
jgi:hypothetical protein